jgi:hypothetical protein
MVAQKAGGSVAAISLEPPPSYVVSRNINGVPQDVRRLSVSVRLARWTAPSGMPVWVEIDRMESRDDPIDGAVLALPYREAGHLYRNNGRRWGSHRPEPTIVTAVLSSTVEPA